MVAIVTRKNGLQFYRDNSGLPYLDYSGLYCLKCDFHDISFPDKVNFSGAILDGANFTEATLREAIFDNSSLFGTRFIEADLRNSKFRSIGDQESSETKSLKCVLNALDNEYQFNLAFPNFSCADLSGADFEHNAIFPAVVTVKREYDANAKKNNNRPWHKTVPESWKSPQNPEHDAIKLKHTMYFSIYKTKEPSADLIETKTRVAENDEVTIGQGYSVNAQLAFGKVADPSDPKDLANIFQTYIRAAMYKARDLKKAFLPEDLDQFLDSSKPTEADFHNTYMRDRPPEEIDPDTICVPRGN